jgi:inosine triphosphate pyrophosphatase
MNNITFVSGNAGKLREICAILGKEISSKDVDLPEIQAIEVSEVVKDKAARAYDELQSPVLIEDTGVYVNSWNGFPGALIKWSMKSMGCEGIYQSLKNLNDTTCYAETIYCLYDGVDFHIFSGKINGKIVAPRGENGFGWDPIFEVGGTGKTFAEMDDAEKNSLSMRAMALKKMLNYLVKFKKAYPER